MTDHMEQARYLLSKQTHSWDERQTFATEAAAHATLALVDAVEALAPQTLTVDLVPEAETYGDARGSDQAVIEGLVARMLMLPMPYRMDVVLEVIAARQKQIDQGYTPEHDDAYGWPHIIEQVNSFQARMSMGTRPPRDAMIQIAGLAIAAVEAYDRGADRG